MIALIALVAAAAAADAPPGLPGIWEGRVGSLPVRACFVSRDWTTFGSYYYMSHRRLIPLDSEEGDAAAFREGSSSDAAAPRWRIDSVAGNRLTAVWSQGRRALPVRLTRIASGGEDGACADMAFHAPRLEGVRTVTRRATVDGVAYTAIALDHGGRFEAGVETFALDGSGEPVRRINAALGRSLAGNPPEWFDCVSDAQVVSPHEGGFDERLAPGMISRRWLSVDKSQDSFCGGAHPNSDVTWPTYDLTTGREVNLHGWFVATAVNRRRVEGMDETLDSLQPAFRQVVLSGWTADDPECGEVVRDADYWHIGLRRTGFLFSPSLPRVVQACGETITVPFDRIRPYLTREAEAFVDALQAERAGR